MVTIRTAARAAALPAAALAAALLASVSASAQYSIMPSVIGNTIGNMVASGKEHECMMGSVPMASRTEAARVAAGTVMADYLARARVAGADATPVFTRKVKLRELVVDGVAGSPGTVADPLAVAAGAGLGAPSAFVRAGDGASVLGLWTVPAAQAGQPALGHYRALLRKEGEGWKLTRLEAISGAGEPAPIAQYCHVQGDVEPYKVKVAEAEAERARKKAARQAARAQREAARD